MSESFSSKDVEQRETADGEASKGLRKPVSIQISLCDNGWLVGVHYIAYRGGAWECGAVGANPNKTFVFNTPEALSKGIKNLVQGKGVVTIP